MRATITIPLRYSHSAGGNFTPAIVHKPIQSVLYPFSIKRLSTDVAVHGVRPRPLKAELTISPV